VNVTIYYYFSFSLLAIESPNNNFFFLFFSFLIKFGSQKHFFLTGNFFNLKKGVILEVFQLPDMRKNKIK